MTFQSVIMDAVSDPKRNFIFSQNGMDILDIVFLLYKPFFSNDKAFFL